MPRLISKTKNPDNQEMSGFLKYIYSSKELQYKEII